MKTMKEFDWDIYKERHNPTKVNWLWLNHNKELSEEEFVLGMQGIKQYSLTKVGLSRGYSPSTLKRDYKYLKEKFGFFKRN